MNFNRKNRDMKNLLNLLERGMIEELDKYISLTGKIL